jgi:hypothetical protein
LTYVNGSQQSADRSVVRERTLAGSVPKTTIEGDIPCKDGHF